MKKAADTKPFRHAKSRISRMEEAELLVRGRHDPCIVPRAVPVVEGMVAFTLADHAIRAGLIPRVSGGDEK